MTAAYATIADVYIYGPKAEMYSARTRQIKAVTLPGYFRMANHGLNPLESFTLSVVGDAIPGKLQPAAPAGLDTVTPYYALSVSSGIFRVALTPGGTPITVTDVGAGMFGIDVDPAFKLGKLLEGTARGVIDERLTNYSPPILPDPLTGRYDEVLVRLNALLTAREAITVFGLANPDFLEGTTAAIDKSLAREWEILDAWMKNRPINVRPGDQTSGNVEGAAIARSDRPSQGWEASCL